VRELSALTHHLGPLYRGTFLFGLACGVSIALTPLFLDEQGFSKEEIGTLALFFAFGLVLFAVPVGGVLRRFGGKVTLTASLIGYAASVAAFPFMESYGSIAVVRFFDGIFSIGVWVSSETILLARADEKHKGHLTSLYAIWLASGYVVGPVVATGLARHLTHQHLFVLAALLAAFAAAYISRALSDTTRDEMAQSETERHVEPTAASIEVDLAPQGAVLSPPRFSTSTILMRIKTSCFAALCYGYFQASVVLFLPLYLIESKGVTRENTIVLPGLFCLGMLLFSNIAGRMGDRFGHLRVVASLSSLGTLCVVGFVFVDTFALMCGLVFLAGATFASMSPVALALVGVVIPRADLSRANSVYNTFYATGMLIGPPISSLVFAHLGGPAMLYHLAALWSSFVIFCLVFLQDDPASRKSTSRSAGTQAQPS
jgi:MFS family permease